ncbi:hypothetical protein [Cupriavidus basilensis]|uniref:hypothetical protein n=1 Tax=Cupriavidus basilensis TaxID=68895 RepID=UPI001185B9AA|nr:hypothetical protein [Cupriavidus basilensis]
MKIIKNIYFSLLVVFLTCNFSYGESLKFNGNSSIAYIDSIPKSEEGEFGVGWKRAVFVGVDGSRIDLFPMEKLSPNGGVLFSDPADALISPSGRFAVFYIVRAGRLSNAGAEGGETITSRQYCPVIDTKSGCIVSNLSGGICGGRWDAKEDLWRVGERSDVLDDTKAMAGGALQSVKEIWESFLEIRARNKGFKLSEIIVSKLGVPNILACEPPSPGNESEYNSISSQLRSEGDLASVEYIKSKFIRLNKD